MAISVYYHPDFLKHEMGLGHPERPQRLEAILTALKAVSWSDELDWVTPKPILKEDLYRVHDKTYIENLFQSVPEAGYYYLDADTALNPFTLKAACLAAGSVKDAVDLVMTDKAQHVACLVRPPGHHAEPDRGMGFCFFNNVAIGAAYALERYNLERIAIVDFDVHHGNGTEKIFRQEPRILFCSSFQYPLYPGVNLSDQPKHFHFYPLPAGSGSEAFKALIEDHLIDTLFAFNPQIIFISAGFDAHKKDPLAELQLERKDYFYITQKIAEVAKACSSNRVISTLEGGYHLKALAGAYVAHLRALR